MFVTTLSSATLALSLIGSVTDVGEPFLTFAFAVLPAVAILGFITFFRVLESSVEDMVYAAAIEPIRRAYFALEPDRADELFLLQGTSALSEMGVTARGRRQLWFTTASTIGSVNSVFVGVIVALGLDGVAGMPIAAAVPVGIVVSLVSVMVHFNEQRRRFARVLGPLGMLERPVAQPV